MNNEFPLKYLEYLNNNQDDADNLEGFYFRADGKKKGLTDEYEFRLLSAQFNVNVIDSQTPSQVKFDVFRRINTGGKPLNAQEIRNCMMEDVTRELVNSLVQSEGFGKATGGSVSDTRMEAQELIMRFIGFWYLRYIKPEKLEYQGDMQNFLNDLVERLNKDEVKYHEHISQDFRRGMENAAHLFGQYSFRKCLPEHLQLGARRQLINKSLFTTWSVLLAPIQQSKVKATIPEKGAFAKILADVLDESRKFAQPTPTFYDAVSYRTNDRTVLEIAFNKTEELIIKHISA
jgi:hypothetical protein